MRHEYNFVCPTCQSHYNNFKSRFVCQCGTVFRRQDDLSQEKINVPTFLMNFTDLLAMISKVDGIVSEEHHVVFESLLRDYGVEDEELQMCLHRFYEWQPKTYERALLFILQRYIEDEQYKAFLLYSCFVMVSIKQAPSIRQLEVLDDIRIVFHISKEMYEQVLQDVLHPTGSLLPLALENKQLVPEHEYALLGVNSNCSQQTLQDAYVKLMRQYEYERAECERLPADIKALMARRTIQVQMAYETILKQRFERQ